MKPKIKNNLARKSIEVMFGSLQSTTIAIIVLLVMSLGWAGDSLLTLWLDFADNKDIIWLSLKNLPILFFLIILSVALFIGRQATKYVSVIPHLTTADNIKGLMVVFSNLHSQPKAALQNHLNEIRLRYLDDSTYQPMAQHENLELAKVGSFGAIFKSIHLHYESLEVLALISSKESRHDIKLLKDAIEIFFPQHGFKIITQEDVMKLQAINEKDVDFEDIEQVSFVLHEMYNYLELSYSEEQILLDVTGGTKATTIAGTIIATANGRKLQMAHQKNHSKIIISLGLEES